MEWIGLLIWILAAAVALPLGRHALAETSALGVQALAGVGGLGLCILFLALGRPPAIAWGAAGLAVVGAIAVAAAAAWLISDRRPVSPAGQAAEELDASLAAIALPLLGFAALASALMALDVGMVS